MRLVAIDEERAHEQQFRFLLLAGFEQSDRPVAIRLDVQIGLRLDIIVVHGAGAVNDEIRPLAVILRDLLQAFHPHLYQFGISQPRTAPLGSR